jgi:RNA polymerase sigma-70 factor, ECF subfamily
VSDESSTSQLADRVRAIVAEARAAHPDVTGDEAAFAAHVAERLEPGTAMVAGDLWMAFAGMRGDPVAMAWIEREAIHDVRPALAAMALPAAAIDDVLQQLRATLFVGDAPKLASYAGRSTLRRWMRSIGVRMALNARRGERGVSLEDVLESELDQAAADPALEHMKDQVRDQLRRSLRDALRSLSARERTALHMHHIDGVTLDQLAAHYGVHRATVARWLAASREQLVTRTLDDVAERLHIDRSEAESALRLVVSRLDLTLDPA